MTPTPVSLENSDDLPTLGWPITETWRVMASPSVDEDRRRHVPVEGDGRLPDPDDACTLVGDDGSAGEHLDEAFDLISYRAGGADPVRKAWKDGIAVLSDRPEFRISELSVESPLRIDGGPRGTFSLYYCLSGEVEVKPCDGAGEAAKAAKGGLVLVPAGLGDFMLIPSGKAALLEIISGTHPEEEILSA